MSAFRAMCLGSLCLGARAVSIELRAGGADVDVGETEKVDIKSKVRQISESEIWRPSTYEPGTPFFVHVPHGSEAELEKAVAPFKEAGFEGSRTRMPANVAFVFPSNHEQSLLQRSFESMSVPFHMIGKDVPADKWSSYTKVGPLLDLIRSQAIPEKYLVFCDGDDVAPTTKDFSGIIDAFEFYNATLVMAASPRERDHMPVISLWEEKVTSWSKDIRGDEGCFMARTKDLGVLLTVIPYPDEPKTFSFAKTLRVAHMNRYPAFKVDSLNMLFKTM